MTNNLDKRVWQRKTHAFDALEGFRDDYSAVRLVYWESFDSCSTRNCPRKATEELAPREETLVYCKDESQLERPGGWVV